MCAGACEEGMRWPSPARRSRPRRQRRIAVRLDVPARRVRRFAERAVAIYERRSRWSFALDVSLSPSGPGKGPFADAVEAIGVAIRAAVLRHGTRPA